MKEYTDLVQKIIDHGRTKADRTHTGTVSIFGHQMRFNMADGFPLLTLKQTSFKAIKRELFWFLSGDTNTKYLTDANVNIWNEWADDSGDLGPIYGKQGRTWDISDSGLSLDQIANVIKQLKQRPDSRRMIVSAWNPAMLPDEQLSPQENVAVGKMALAPCHLLFQFYTEELTEAESAAAIMSKNNNCTNPTRKLSIQVYQRSADVFLGVPYNIASYSLLLHMVAKVVNMVPGELVYSLGDAHLYNNHLEQAEVMISRTPLGLSRLYINSGDCELDDIREDECVCSSYASHSPLRAAIAI